MIRRGFLDNLFPAHYDFFGMLSRQADLTAQGSAAFALWLEGPTDTLCDDLQKFADESDSVRMGLEKQLLDAFTTPFDREDVYIFSVRMDRILEVTKSAALSIKAYSFPADNVLFAMANNLGAGTDKLAKGTALLATNPKQANEMIEPMRRLHLATQTTYRDALASLFLGGNPMAAMKSREVYFEMLNASTTFDLVIDVFHRIIVRLI
jgi:uncharacterized protein